ncbi:bifunctional 3'-5' exonuclease/DNA polymerase [Kineosporia sp. J2-2]|uniref:DNA-directed DNA polymerase n=1 Tax=Kineosporia corallincola TaxID=2835133 RepID=A0ABS5TBF1_9ACTN|nr:bifunctional 3'-5' exonuclease/DNA polymerase [Kineosporia corallincola]MBT0767458.1 bifunctional 3'-5' exonuclease/DNA polymerase [Kineosporia corallincola]
MGDSSLTSRDASGVERVLIAASGPGFEMQPVDAAGAPTGPVRWTADLAATALDLERHDRPRWVWWRTAEVYPVLLEAGVRVERCHDLAAVENLLRTHAGERFTSPQSVAHEPPRGRSRQTSLFDAPADPAQNDEEPGRPQPPAGLAGLRESHASQARRIAGIRPGQPGFPLLVAAESAACLAAVEMGRAGLPWSTRIHDRVLTDLLGPRPQHHGRPRLLQALAEEVSRLLGGTDQQPMNPDSPADVLRAFRRQGVVLETTRAWELKQVDHPAVTSLLRYKELSRLHVAHGWAWQDQWVRAGRFHAEYVPGGVVTGRWATSGGGALQIPKVMRGCVVADPGWVLVAADAGQLEPRILAALSGDRGMIAATADPDLYTALAQQALGRPEARQEAKIGLLAAMYGARANSPAMGALRRRFPQALDLLERAARTGENGGIVRSVLGRTCPPPESSWQDVPPEKALARSRARGRFTRNFVIQASAADWANALVAGLRRRLAAMPSAGSGRAELVFFQHDEVIVHAPATLAEAVVSAVVESGAEATSLVLGERGVHIPLAAAPIASYAEKN